MRTIVIGDIHGCNGALQALLKKTKADPEGDRLILLGDLFDRGPDSFEVFQTVRELAQAFAGRFTLLMGNHEDYLLTEKLSLMQRLVWERVGRGATVRSFREHGKKMEDAIPWLKKRCALYARGEGFQCAHAGLAVDPVEVNDRQTLLHDHDIVLRNAYAGPLAITGHIALAVPRWFAGDKKTARELPYGEWRKLPEKGVICIDTGCGKGGRLTAMAIEDGRFCLESVAEK